ncbi:hypothetical protein ColTof4_06432 [Colletotrichum tofieldiae]|nr:hypothetical protein ColTof3_01626 [Colletotrichum tofieldiae]GKT74009.1 hypothetical protein ColTof4_06432 [Colletotrichum tofieldiae]
MTSSRELFGRIVEIMDENEGVENTVSEGNGGVQEAFKRAVEVEDESEVFVVGQTTPGPGEIKERVSTARKYELRDGENHAQPISRWKYPWVVVMLVLFMLFVPSCKEII